MPISLDEWASIRALAERVVAQNGGGQQIMTAKVAKVDPDRKVIFVPELGDQPIPVVDFESYMRNYDHDVPVGTIAQSADDVPPENYLLANGQAVSRAQYPELFAVIGTDYGAGDGSTTFNVPLATFGGGGGSDKNYVHTQSTPSATWSVAHGLGKFPAVDVIDTGNSVIIPNVQHVDVNSLTVTFGSPTSGKVVCN